MTQISKVPILQIEKLFIYPQRRLDSSVEQNDRSGSEKQNAILQAEMLQIEGNTLVIGANGVGKSSLLHTVMAHPNYQVSKDTKILWQGEDISEYSAYQRASLGMFLGFQDPVSIPGLSLLQLAKHTADEKRSFHNLPPIDPAEFLAMAYQKASQLKLSREFLKRDVNSFCSGGEKKLSEFFQCLMIDPTFMMLDEIDSGLDMDSTRNVMQCLAAMKGTKVIVTHSFSNARLMGFFQKILILSKVNQNEPARIIETEDMSILLKIEEYGYDFLH